MSELEDLIERTARNDESAFHALYEETRSAVYGFAMSILKHPQDAEDAMQDTYLSIYHAASGYASRGKPMAWILTITRNHCMMKLRGQKRRGETSLEELERWVEGQSSLPAEEKLILEQALKTLNEEEYQIVTLHSLGDLRHREIAHLLDMKLSTVLSKYRRALAKLRAIIGEEA
ncbi:MAG: RNA polymerase sigma factor [Lachnospiraceae bacterium]|nr:RNA polymerase sigma factor [Lachnospiraceae bacterium]